eukprot:CAMPEP_0167741786 /NCGR_PEP_ID=MMETSP0110_2-20121227/1051_1 /TAXON_ID=629695 /ORGANISM="Gymnochlora sp., Strain CCMP2014" /LENGTH=128 /DNA_ID=CAMNT_0007625879 /DNA_START=204 /DNA_END=587 /DNA_ORIENTATION=+
MPDPNWVGFYLSRPVFNEAEPALILGPFNGKPAVVKISYGSGVCGITAEEKVTQIVDDVHNHPNHIACDSASQSEIVVPLLSGEDFWGVLDIDSPNLAAFDVEDQKGLESICSQLIDGVDFEAYCKVP